MSNVLTLEEKKNLGRKMRNRYILVAALIVALGGITACISIAPALISVQIAHASLTQPTAEEEAARDDQQKAGRAQALVGALDPLVSATTSPSGAIASVIELAPSGISISTVTYQLSSHQLVLTGTSQGRQAVNEFRDALETSGLFTEVAIPVSALVGTQDGRFTITLKGNI